MSSVLIRIDPSTLSPSDIRIATLFQLVQALSDLTPLRRIGFSRQIATPLVYDWLVMATDGRTWQETIRFSSDNDPNPHLTFNVPEGWLVTEVVGQKALKDAIVLARNQFGIMAFDIEWVTTSTPAQQIILLMVSPGTLPAGSSVTVHWLAPNATATDWIGLYHTGADNHAYLDYVYAAGQSDGSHAFATTSLTAGQYEFRYLLNNGYTSVATSVTFTLT